MSLQIIQTDSRGVCESRDSGSEKGKVSMATSDGVCEKRA